MWKGNHSRPWFELVSPCSFPTTITITPRAPPFYCVVDGMPELRFMNECHKSRLIQLAFLGHFRRKAMYSALLCRYCIRLRSPGTRGLAQLYPHSRNTQWTTENLERVNVFSLLLSSNTYCINNEKKTDSTGNEVVLFLSYYLTKRKKNLKKTI